MAKSRANPGFGAKFQISDGGSTSGVAATKINGASNAIILYTARTAGTGGNSITVAQLNGGASQPLSVSVVGLAISVNLATDGSSVITSTASDAIDAINSSAAASALVLATNGAGNGSSLATAVAVGNLTGGSNAAAVWTDLGEITEIPGVGTTHRIDEVTHMSSPNGWAEFIGLGVKEGKSFTLGLNFVADDTQAKLLYRTRVESGVAADYRVAFTDVAGTTLTFSGIITDSDIGHARDSKADLSIQVQPTGPFAWAP